MKTKDSISIFTSTAHSDSHVDNLARIALDIGEGLLKSGAEIHRVEDAIEHICRAYGAAHVEVFSIQSLIVVAIRMPDGTYAEQSRRITNISNHLRCLEHYNRLSREICQSTPDFDEVDRRIFEIKQKRKYPFILIFLGHICAASGFAIFFGGSLRDGLAAALVGMVMALLDRINAKFFTPVTKTLLISFFGGLCSCLTVMLHIGESVNMIAIGTIMILIPGLALGNSMRDLLSGDTLAGILRAVQSCIIAVIIAIGYSISIFMMSSFYVEPAPAQFELWQKWTLGLFSAFIGTIGFALIFKISLKKLLTVGIGGACTFVIYELIASISSNNVLLATFVASVFMAMFSEVCARSLRAPAVVFLFPCAIPIVPGSALYYTMYYLLKNENEKFLTNISTAGQVLLGLALGLSVATVIWGIISYILKHIFKNKQKSK